MFLLRTFNAADIALLKQIGQLVGGSAGALGIIGVASRADEIGAGRIDAMQSAADVAQRFTKEIMTRASAKRCSRCRGCWR